MSKSANLSIGLMIISSAPVDFNSSFLSFSETIADIKFVGFDWFWVLDFNFWHNYSPLLFFVFPTLSRTMLMIVSGSICEKL